MNIFYIEESPADIAASLVDKHTVKMVLESTQMLSTAHRLLDGLRIGNKTPKFLLPGEIFDPALNLITNLVCCNVAHPGHPSTVWTMKCKENYDWHFQLLVEMAKEYTSRYGRIHDCEKMFPFLKNSPKNIKSGVFTPPTPAMPDKYLSKDVMQSYRDFYVSDKWRFARWKQREIPQWFIDGFIKQKEIFLPEIIQSQKVPNKRKYQYDARLLGYYAEMF
jgi:hypothetical protein